MSTSASDAVKSMVKPAPARRCFVATRCDGRCPNFWKRNEYEAEQKEKQACGRHMHWVCDPDGEMTSFRCYERGVRRLKYLVSVTHLHPDARPSYHVHGRTPSQSYTSCVKESTRKWRLLSVVFGSYTQKNGLNTPKCGTSGAQKLRYVKFCACIINFQRVSSIRFLDISGSFSEYPNGDKGSDNDRLFANFFFASLVQVVWMELFYFSTSCNSL